MVFKNDTYSKKEINEILLKIESNIVVDYNGCWNWTRCVDACGYGRLRIKGKLQSVHRLSFAFYHGEEVEALHVCHKCDNPGCVNTRHLFSGSIKDNMRDKYIKGRAGFTGPKKKEFCFRGHKLIPENLYFYLNRNTKNIYQTKPRPEYKCRECIKINCKKKTERKIALRLLRSRQNQSRSNAR